jgi:hypothetical protein
MSDLSGPAAGVVALPSSVYWGPDPIVDLSEWDDVAKAYEATIREGDEADVCAILNADVLRRVWSRLFLPITVRQRWEARFGPIAA